MMQKVTGISFMNRRRDIILDFTNDHCTSPLQFETIQLSLTIDTMFLSFMNIYVIKLMATYFIAIYLLFLNFVTIIALFQMCFNVFDFTDL